MKYNININQVALAETTLDVKDASILDYIIVICESKSKSISSKRLINEQGEWTWINYERLMKDMPLLRFKSKGSVTPRIQKIENEDFIDTFQSEDGRLFVKLTNKIDTLFFDTVQKYEQPVQKAERVLFKKLNIHNNTIHNNTTNTPFSEATASEDISLCVFNYWNEQKIVTHKKLTSKMKTKIKSSLKEFSLEDIKLSIQKYGEVLNEEKYYWTYKWTLEEFLQRGLTKFLDTPKDDFLKSTFEKVKEKKPFYEGSPMVKKFNKWYVIRNSEWLEFADEENKIEWLVPTQ